MHACVCVVVYFDVDVDAGVVMAVGSTSRCPAGSSRPDGPLISRLTVRAWRSRSWWEGGGGGREGCNLGRFSDGRDGRFLNVFLMCVCVAWTWMGRERGWDVNMNARVAIRRHNVALTSQELGINV